MNAELTKPAMIVPRIMSSHIVGSMNESSIPHQNPVQVSHFNILFKRLFLNVLSIQSFGFSNTLSLTRIFVSPKLDNKKIITIIITSTSCNFRPCIHKGLFRHHPIEYHKNMRMFQVACHPNRHCLCIQETVSNLPSGVP